MSSYSDNHQPSSSQFLPPQSAQVRNSLFGGPSSDVDPPPSSLPEPAQRSIFGGFSSQDVAQEPEKQPESMHPGESDQEEDDLDMILRERPLEAYYGSDGDSFRGSSDDDHIKASQRVSEKTKKLEAKAPKPKKVVAPQPTYVLHRGVDLPPGVERPNRWAGHPRTYQRLITPEINILDALNNSRAKDLAGHLYDSFVARQQPKLEVGVGDPDDPDYERIKRIPKKWTAWPFHSSSVPRADEPVRRRLDEVNTYRMQPDTRPSAELEEWIMATMTRTAKERFLAREWDDEEIGILKKEELPDPNAMIKDEDSKESKLDIIEQFESEPAVQTDDDISHHQLRPLSRTVISQLDRLLMGLHDSFKYRAKHHLHLHLQYSSDESATDSDEESSPPPVKMKDQKPDASRSSRSRSHSESESEAEADEILEYDESSDEEEVDDLKGRLPLRDWSEVMGIASIVGLPPDAIKRASKRCADIFDQDMTFRKFNEGRMVKVRRLRGGRNLHEYAYGESETESDSAPSKPVRGKGKIYQSTRLKSVPRESSNEPERYIPKKSRSPSAAAAAPPLPPPATASQARFGKDPNKDSVVFCPVEGCKRSRDGFNRRWNLNLHMKKMHPAEHGKGFPSPP